MKQQQEKPHKPGWLEKLVIPEANTPRKEYKPESPPPAKHGMNYQFKYNKDTKKVETVPGSYGDAYSKKDELPIKVVGGRKMTNAEDAQFEHEWREGEDEPPDYPEKTHKQKQTVTTSEHDKRGKLISTSRTKDVKDDENYAVGGTDRKPEYRHMLTKTMMQLPRKKRKYQVLDKIITRNDND